MAAPLGRRWTKGPRGLAAYFSGLHFIFLVFPIHRNISCPFGYFKFSFSFAAIFLFPLGRVLFEQPDSSASTNNLTPVANNVEYERKINIR